MVILATLVGLGACCTKPCFVSKVESCPHNFVNTAAWNQFVIKLRNDKYFLNQDFSNLFDTDCKKYYSLRNLVKQQLFEKGINSIIYYPIPIHAQIAYKNKNFSRTKLINTERICTEVLSLPMFPEISYEEQVYVAENLNKVLKNCIEEIQISA